MIVIGFNSWKLQDKQVNQKELYQNLEVWRGILKNRKEGEKIEIAFGKRAVDRVDLHIFLLQLSRSTELTEGLGYTVNIVGATCPETGNEYSKYDIYEMIEKTEDIRMILGLSG